MLRVLAECKASVRKSFQGLDYFAADGARAFEDLQGNRRFFLAFKAREIHFIQN